MAYDEYYKYYMGYLKIMCRVYTQGTEFNTYLLNNNKNM